MAKSDLRGVVDYLKRISLKKASAQLSDGSLLEAFISRREESAFASIVRRHGPMVMGVCRRVLRDPHDAEDAFQATFLVLARKATSISSRELLAHWLYSVAFKTSLKAHATIAKRKTRERQVTPMPDAEVTGEEHSDFLPMLDLELSRLPEKYRLPIILCELEGKTLRQAAHQLGWPEGTVSGRLSRGRNMLAKRLRARGIELSSAALASLLAQQSISAAVPASLVASTARAATIVSSGAAAAGIVSANVAHLVEGVLKAMLIAKLKTGAAVLLLLATFGIAGSQAFQAASPDANPTLVPAAMEQKTDTKAKSADAAPPEIPPREIRIQLLLKKIVNNEEEYLSAPIVNTVDGVAVNSFFGGQTLEIHDDKKETVTFRQVGNDITFVPKQRKDGRCQVDITVRVSEAQPPKKESGELVNIAVKTLHFETIVQSGDKSCIEIFTDNAGNERWQVQFTVEILPAGEKQVKSFVLKRQSALNVAIGLGSMWKHIHPDRESIRILHADGTNTLFVIADPSVMGQIERLIHLLDESNPDAGK